ncbi:MAG: penicillin-binding transpeptidase domain-containing protein, partial [Actinomycetota bacterium]|nr:penicillin-binding transpeptidase domain-containing protein [Actinomycetota bacterium]
MMGRVSRRSRAVVMGAGLALVVPAALGGCDLVGGSKPATPDATVKALADGLAGGDLTKVPFDGATGANVAAFMTTVTADLKDLKRTVKVTQVSKPNANDSKATATLTFVWTIPASLSSPAATATATGTTTGTATTTPAPTTTPADGSDGLWTYTTPVGLTRAQDTTWHVAWNPTIIAPDLTTSERLTLTTAPAKRADIVGANNVPLMTERATATVGIDKTRIPAASLAASATALAQLAGSDPAAYAAQVAAAGSKAFVPLITVRADDALVTEQAGAIAAIPGASVVGGKAVVGPSPTFARSLLGTVGEATAELVQKSNGALHQGDIVGLSGLEQRYDIQLRGTSGVTVRAVVKDTAGKVTTSRDLFTRPATDGRPLQLTMDATAQTVAEAVLQGVTTTPAAIVAIRPSTGEILASANGPAAKGIALGTSGQVAPGSTFKIVTALALLRAGLTPDSIVSCTPTFNAGGRIFKNYNDYPPDKVGNIPLRTAFANSCNTAFISNNAKITQADLASAAAALGVGVDLDLGFPAYLGSVPTSAGSTEHAASMIGQASVLVAPMDMATVAASVMHAAVVRPRLIADNPAVAGFPTPATPLQPAEAQALQSMMGAVVSEGSGRSLAGVGVTLAKSGTA